MKGLGLLTIAMVLLAGCSGGRTAPTTVPSTSPARTAPSTHDVPSVPPTLEDSVAFRGCTNVGARFGVRSQDAAALLPEGFEPVEWRAPGTAALFVESTSCTSVRVGNEDVGAGRWFYAELDVTAPEASRLAGTDSYTIPVFTAATPQGLADAFVRWKVADAGTGTITDDGSTPNLHRIHVTAHGLELDMEERLEDATQAGAAASVRLFGVQERKVASVVDEVATASSCHAGSAVLTVQGGPAILGQALPGATGGLCAGYDVVLRRTT